MKVGLFFGSFNPIHIGHMMLAEYILEFTDIERVWFIVSPQNPFKEQTDLLDKEERMNMVKMAIFGNDKFHASDVEFDMPTPSYTCDTLKVLKEKYPNIDFYLLVGVDTYDQMKTWKNAEYVDSFPQLVYPRFTEGTHHHTWGMKKMGNATYVEAPLIQISSTFVRKAISEGKNIKSFLPPLVYNQIKEKGFYK